MTITMSYCLCSCNSPWLLFTNVGNVWFRVSSKFTSLPGHRYGCAKGCALHVCLRSWLNDCKRLDLDVRPHLQQSTKLSPRPCADFCTVPEIFLFVEHCVVIVSFEMLITTVVLPSIAVPNVQLAALRFCPYGSWDYGDAIVRVRIAEICTIRKLGRRPRITGPATKSSSQFLKCRIYFKCSFGSSLQVRTIFCVPRVSRSAMKRRTARASLL